MKKNTILVLIMLSLLSVNFLQAQVNIGGTPKSYECEKNGIFIESPVFVQTAPLDMAAIEAEDAQWEMEMRLGDVKIGRRFGIEFEVDYDLYNSGTWTFFPDGSELWRLGVECPDALTINLIFDRYRLPAGATLYIYDVNKRDLIGGFTNYNNQDDWFFATDLVEGSKIIIEYYQPANTEFEAELKLGTIVHGYRGTLSYEKGFGGSGACQRNAICPEGDNYRDQIRSVCTLRSGGSEFCSGALINNTANDKTPYVLTANHCWNAYQNPGIWVFKFRWESVTCTPSTNNSDYVTMSGATLKMRTNTNANNPGAHDTDCCLVQINNSIPNNYDVYFAGWSRATTAPPSVLIVHHPALDIKKITPSTDISAVVQYVPGWRANFPVGGACTEGGSSGSPIFDHNQRIIGQEYGGQSRCGGTAAQMFDVWGRLDVSWDANTPNSLPHLKTFLDPSNLNSTTLDGINNIVTTTTVDAELLNIITPEATYTTTATIAPKVTIKNNGTTAITSATVSYTLNSGTPVSQTWTGTLAAGATTDVTFPNITLTYGNHVFTATVTVAGDANAANNSKTKNFSVLSVDAELLNIITPETTYYTPASIAPKVTIKNAGTAPMTSATVSYTIDGGTAVSQTWTGTLAAGATADVTFNTINLTVGSHVFVATVTIPNDINAANNSKTKNYEVITVDAELLNIITPEATYYAIETIAPKVTIKNNGSGNLTSATVAYTIDGGTAVSQTWTGTLAAGATTDVTFNAITLTVGAHVFVATVTVANDANAANNSKTKNYEVITVDAELLDIIVPEETYYAIETIEPKVTIKNNGSGNLTSATVSYTIDGGTPVSQTWTGTLAAGATEDVTFDAITLTYGTHVFETTVTVANDANASNNSKTRNYEVIMVDAELLDIIVPEETYYAIETIEPKVTIKNNGTATLTSAVVFYTIDGGTPVSQTWTGTLAAGATEDVIFDAITLTYGTHVFETTITAANDANAANDTQTRNYEVITPACLPVENLDAEQTGNTITLSWEYPEDTEHITGYTVYVNGTENGTYTSSPFILTVELIEPEDYEFCVVALYNYEWCEESSPECVSITTTVSIKELSDNPIKIYPNPAHSQIFIDGGALVKSVEIYNLQGKQLYLQTGDLHSIEVSRFASGNYLITVSIENGQKVTKLITIKH